MYFLPLPHQQASLPPIFFHLGVVIWVPLEVAGGFVVCDSALAADRLFVAVSTDDDEDLEESNEDDE